MRDLDHVPGDQHYEDLGTDRDQFMDSLHGFRASLEEISIAARSTAGIVRELILCGGHDKDGAPEAFDVRLQPGEITGIVGPTGSGKSRLLADIEWMAQGDTPTGRRLLVNGSPPDPAMRFSLEHKIVAQLSQNMNFVMDASAQEFIRTHAESRMVNDPGIVDRIIGQANELAGEPFSHDTPVTSLSGGQSRALMIADTALISRSPVVLIDEIENAGIDRKRALRLLVQNEKIVLVATHDPILALMCSKRLVIRNGAVVSVIETAPEEIDNLVRLEHLDRLVQSLRQRIRTGQRIAELNDLDDFVAMRWK